MSSTACNYISGPAAMSARGGELEMSHITSSRFQLEACLQRSRTGLVVLAFDTEERCKVALKIASPAQYAADGSSERLMNEMEIAESLPDHPNLTRVRGLYPGWLPDGRTVQMLAIDYADGGSLRDWFSTPIASRSLRLQEGVDYFRDACVGVSAIHEAGVIHLDLKPENILLLNGEARISDFEAALKVDQNGGAFSRAGRLSDAGTAPYMSPELFTARVSADVDPRSDIYSLGVILYEIVSPGCRLPFVGSYRHVQRLHESADPPDIPVPAPLKNVLARCLAKHPAERWQSVDQLLDALDQCLGQSLELCAARPEEVTVVEQALADSLATGAYTEAIVHCEAILGLDPGHRYAERTLRELKSRSASAESLYTAAEQGMESAELGQTLLLIKEADDAFPGHPSGVAVIARVRQRVAAYKQHIEAGVNAAVSGDLHMALRFAANALDANPKSITATTMVQHVERRIELVEHLRANLTKAVQDRQFDRALAVAKRLDAMGAPAMELDPISTGRE